MNKAYFCIAMQLLFTEKSNMASFLDKIVDDVEDFRCECKISESCQVCETKKLPQFPEENFNIPLYLSKVYEIIHAVFIFKSATIKNQTNYEDEFFKLRSDNESLKVKAKRLQDEIDGKTKIIGSLENQLSLMSKSSKVGNDKFGQEKEEMNQRIIKLQNKVQVMQNDFKKKELEFLKMKDQLRSKDRITYANRYDTMPLKSINQNNGQDAWINQRKNLIDELCQLQDTAYYILGLLNQFFSQTSNFEPINPDIIKMPQHGNKCVLWLKSQLEKLNPNISSPILEKQQQVSHSKTNSVSSSAKKETLKMSRSHTLHFQEPNETMSIISRISINDVSLSSVNSAKFNEPIQQPKLKKWEFVFK